MLTQISIVPKIEHRFVRSCNRFTSTLSVCRLLTLAVAVLALCCEHARSEDSPVTTGKNTAALNDIIQSLHEYEQLCANLEVEWSTRYELYITDRSPGFTKKKSLTGRSILQDDMHYVSYSSDSETLGGAQATNRKINAFDGEKTRILSKNGKVGNIVSGKQLATRLFRPHSLPLFRNFVKVPLSVWFKGREAIRTYPGTGGNIAYDEIWNRKPSFAGVETVDGLQCLKLVVESTRIGGESKKVEHRKIFWLAEDRSFLPIRVRGFRLALSDSLPIEEFKITELNDCGSGIWIPKRTNIVIYDKKRLPDGDHVPIAEYHLSVTHINTNPSYSREFFQGVEFPKGCSVYEVKDRKIIRSYEVGAPESPQADEISRTRRSWLLWGNAAFALAIGVAFVIRAKIRAPCN